jgi:competence protein ComEC
VPMIAITSAWLLGIVIGHFLHPGRWLAFVGLLPFFLLIFTTLRRKVLIIAAFGFLAICGAAAFVGPPPQNDIGLRSYNDAGPVQIKGMVNRSTEIGPQGSRLYLAASAILIDGNWQSISGTALIFTGRYPQYQYGDLIFVRGSLQNPEVFADFDYAGYLAQQGIFSTISYPNITVTGHDGSPFLRWLFSVRNSLSTMLGRVLPEPQASLAQGIALGLRSNIPKSLTADFTRTGTTHLLAISGVNLTIVAGILVTIILWLFGRRHFLHIYLTIAVILIYAWLTGLQPPVLRAVVMLAIFLSADLFGRQKSAIIALLLAACLMTMFDPGVLSEASFQLSFLAMTGLIFVSSPLQQASQDKIASLLPEGRTQAILNTVSSSFIVSLGAMIATWPLIAYYFGVFSWIGPLATFVTMPVLPAIIVTCILSGMLGLFLLPVGQIIGWIAWLPLSYMIVIVSALVRIPGISFGISGLSAGHLALYYGFLIAIIIGIQKRASLRRFAGSAMHFLTRLPVKWAAPPIAVIALFTWLFAITIPDQNIHVSFLDVGQGDAILIEQGTRQILVDGGPNPQATTLALSRKMPFWDRTIDLLVLTHPDADHLGGLVDILDRYHVKSVLSANFSNNSPLYQAWLTAIAKKDIRTVQAFPGQTITMGDNLSISVLNPPATPVRDSPLNDLSVVLRVEAGQFTFLLTGDLGSEGEQRLIDGRAPLKSTILKVGHHGSDTATGEEFLKAVSPDIAVISVGSGNNFGHPNSDVVSRLVEQVGIERIYRTDEDGTIEFITDGAKLRVITDK